MSAIQKCNDGAGQCTYIIRRADESFWSVSTPDHRSGGYFRSMDDARRFARSELRCRDHGEVIVLGDCFCDVETFDGYRIANVVHVDSPAARFARGVA